MEILRTKIALLFAMCFLLLTYGCGVKGSENGNLIKKVQAMERKVDFLQKQVDDQTVKANIAGSLLFNSPLDQFFQSPEFWERTYDSRQADCSRRCIKETQAARKVCSEITDEQDRLQCYQEAHRRAGNCQRQCAALP